MRRNGLQFIANRADHSTSIFIKRANYGDFFSISEMLGL